MHRVVIFYLKMKVNKNKNQNSLEILKAFYFDL